MERLVTIKKRVDFLKAGESGLKVATGLFIMLALKKNGQEGTRFGFTVTKKVGNAVVRNRIRRRLKEIVRKNCPIDANADIVIIARNAIADAEFSRMERYMQKAFLELKEKLP